MASDAVDGHVLVAPGYDGRLQRLPVVEGRIMRPLVLQGSGNDLSTDGYETHMRRIGTPGGFTVQTLEIFLGSAPESLEREEECLDKIKEMVWNTRDEAAAEAAATAGEMAVIGGVVHTSLQEPAYLYDTHLHRRSMFWPRLAEWSTERHQRIVARADRYPLDGDPFADGLSVEGDLETVRWRFRDVDANALQTARYVLTNQVLGDVFGFQGRLSEVRKLSRDIVRGVPGAAASLVEVVDAVVAGSPHRILGQKAGGSNHMGGGGRSEMLRTVESIRHVLATERRREAVPTRGRDAIVDATEALASAP